MVSLAIQFIPCVFVSTGYGETYERGHPDERIWLQPFRSLASDIRYG